MERTLIGSLIAAILAMVGWFIGSRNKVSFESCRQSRIDLVGQHDAQCLLKLKPVHDKLDRLETKVDQLLERRESPRG